MDSTAVAALFFKDPYSQRVDEALEKYEKFHTVAARMTGVPQQTASRWDEENLPLSNTHVGFTKLPDTRFSISKADRQSLTERVKAGESQAQVAADYGISKGRVSQIVSKASKPPTAPKGPYVSKSGVEWTDYALNIYLGCAHNCDYCYAKLMNGKTGWVEDWTQPRKRDIDLEELFKELDSLEPGNLFFCSITDAYQPLNRELDWAGQVLSVLLSKKHITTLILTKSSDVERDLDDICNAHNTLQNVKLGFTITCLDDATSKNYEPGASPPSERIRVLRKAHELGIPTRGSASKSSARTTPSPQRRSTGLQASSRTSVRWLRAGSCWPRRSNWPSNNASRSMTASSSLWPDS